MDSDRHSPDAICYRFRRALLTDYQPAADRLFNRANELMPVVREEFEGDLMDYEIFLLACLLANIREIQELKEMINSLQEMG